MLAFKNEKYIQVEDLSNYFVVFGGDDKESSDNVLKKTLLQLSHSEK